MPIVLPWSLPLGTASFLEQPRLRIAGIWHELLWRRRRSSRPQRTVLVAADPLVSFVCVSKRPAQLEHVVETWQHQHGCRVELILVTNADGYMSDARTRLDGDAQVTLIESDPSQSLGAALNLGVAAASGHVVAKIDDDDYYASSYASDLVEAMRRTGAGVVGKKTYFVHLAAADEVIKMYPGNEDQRVGRVAGGTIGFHRDVAAVVSFDDRTLGEDVGFVRAAERAGYAIHSGKAQGYLQVRHAALGHTWSIADDQLAASAEPVGAGREDSLWQ